MFKAGSIYLLSNVLYAVIPFALIPFLTRTLEPSEYGQIAMFQMLLVGLSGIIGLNSSGASARYYFEDVSDNEKSVYNTHCLFMLLFSSALCFLLFVLLKDWLVSKLNISVFVLITAIVVSVCNFIIQLRLTQWQVRSEAIKYGITQISNGVLLLAATVLIFTLIRKDSNGYIIGNISSVCILALICFISLVRSKMISFSLIKQNVLKDILIFGLPLIPHVFGGFLLTSFDRVIINTHLGLEATGIYTLAFQASLALKIVFDSLNRAFVPYLYAILKRNEMHEKLQLIKRTYIAIVLLLVFSIIGFLVSPNILIFVAGPKYSNASHVIGYLILGQVFAGMYLMVTNYLFYAKQTVKLAIVTLMTGAFNIIVMLWALPIFGLKGVAYSFCLSMLLRFIFTWILASRSVEMPWFRLLSKEKL